MHACKITCCMHYDYYYFLLLAGTRVILEWVTTFMQSMRPTMGGTVLCWDAISSCSMHHSVAEF